MPMLDVHTGESYTHWAKAILIFQTGNVIHFLTKSCNEAFYKPYCVI